MQYYDIPTADSYLADSSVPQKDWENLSPDDKNRYLKMASSRLDTFNWNPPLETQAKRIADPIIKDIFFEYLRFLLDRAGRPPQQVGKYAVNAYSDLPMGVASRIKSIPVSYTHLTLPTILLV